MAYVKVTNGNVDTYPYNVGQLRRDNPNTSFPKQISDSILNSWDVYSVTILDTPSHDMKAQNVVTDSTPTLQEGVWTIGHTIVSKTAEEITEYNETQAGTNRGTRDALLGETDWWASSDLTMTAEQTAYRQALRDITSHANWPHLDEADWPTKP